MTAEDEWSIFIPASRGRALTRGILWALPAAIFGAAALSIYRELDFSPTGISKRIVDLSTGLIALPLPLLGLWCGMRAVRWFLLAAWPSRVGILADDSGLTLRLGPLGVRRFDRKRLDVRYLFELSADLEEEGFEAFLPEEEQIARFLPRITHPATKDRINAVILRYTVSDESAVAAQLRPAIERWRTTQPTLTLPKNPIEE